MQLSVRTAVLLVVEDDPLERARLVAVLTPMAGAVRQASSVNEALRICVEQPPDLVVLDLGLPDGEGLEVLLHVRSVCSAAVLVHSGRTNESEKVALLDAGADDFVDKPVGEDELAARVRALLRRVVSDAAEGNVLPAISIPGLEIDAARERVLLDGSTVRLSPTEWAILRALLMHAGSTVTHERLWSLVWGREFGDARLHLRVHVAHLRQKLERGPNHPRLIVTEPGVGYRLEQP